MFSLVFESIRKNQIYKPVTHTIFQYKTYISQDFNGIDLIFQKKNIQTNILFADHMQNNAIH